MKKFYITGIHWKIWFLGGGIHEKPKYRGLWPKEGALDRL